MQYYIYNFNNETFKEATKSVIKKELNTFKREKYLMNVKERLHYSKLNQRVNVEKQVIRVLKKFKSMRIVYLDSEKELFICRV